MGDYVLGLALISSLWGIISAIVMAAYVSKKGHRIDLLFFRLYIFKYIHQYSKITTEENGKPGVWLYSFIIAMNLALIITIVGILLQ